MEGFISVFISYLLRILPALIFGFFLSGLIYEFIPDDWVEKVLGKKGLAAIFYATLTGTILPVCCWGSLPVAISFYKKGSRLGPVLAFLVATPATSIVSLLVAFQLLGVEFMLFEFFAVIIMGVAMGLISDRLVVSFQKKSEEVCLNCSRPSGVKSFLRRLKAALYFSFYQLPKQIGLEIFVGIILASAVASFPFLGEQIRSRLSKAAGYFFALVFSLVMYVCATATVPFVDAFIRQGLDAGAGMVILLAGPVTSYGTIFVLKKEFGLKILLVYLGFISFSSLLLGYIFSFMFTIKI